MKKLLLAIIAGQPANAWSLILNDCNKYSTNPLSADFSSTTTPITLSGKHASKVNIPVSAILAAIVPYGQNFSSVKLISPAEPFLPTTILSLS